VDREDEAGNTPLHRACKHGNPEVVKLLLQDELGAGCVNKPNKIGATPLHSACLEKFLDDYIEHFVYKMEDGETKKGAFDRLQVVDLLLKHGAKINAADETGSTPLITAYSCRKIKVAKFLVNKGADINLANIKGQTLLHMACLNGDMETVTYLLHKGADVNCQDTNDNGPLHMAYGRKHTKVVRFLLAHGAEKKAKNRAGERPFEAKEDALWTCTCVCMQHCKHIRWCTCEGRNQLQKKDEPSKTTNRSWRSNNLTNLCK
jgi:ankyrin repeat protein